MRIGIELIAVQSPWSRHRGIGRLGHNLVAALLAHGGHEFLLYAHDGLPTDRIPEGPGARIVTLHRQADQGEASLRDVMDRLVRTNPDRLDALVLLSPLELYGGFGPPAKPLNGLAIAAYVHDVIPFLFQENYLDEPTSAARMYRYLEELRRYDVLLANSDATRADFLRLLGLRPTQVVTVGCASEGQFFQPDRSQPSPPGSADLLRGLGIDRPFVFHLGSMDEKNDRKNLLGLVDAFGLLPEPLRRSHQLVLSCYMNDAFAGRVRKQAEERGIGDAIVLTGDVHDDVLRVLYQRCAAFAFCSFYEGFGLPLLEAMQCGAAVVAGNNSSQIEVVGGAGLLANAHDPADIAAKLARPLADPALAAELGRKALEQAQRFSWEKTAGLALDALDRVAGRGTARRLRADRPHQPRPRLAVFSPFAPKSSGISDYIARLLDQWKDRYTIDLFHEVGYEPEPGLNRYEFGSYDYRLFERYAAVRDYRGIIYQMGNSIYHRFVYQTMLKHPGIVTLHDFCLSAFQYWWSHLPGATADAFEREVEHCCPELADEYIAQLGDWSREPGGLQVACARRGLYLNRRVFEHSRAVVVHSPWCVDRVREHSPEFLDRTAVIPLGARAERVEPEVRAEVRARFDLPADALVFASFGILSHGKMNAEAIEAFAPVAKAHPEALFLFVGADWEQGEARRAAEGMGLEHRVRFLGRQPSTEFDALASAVDVGVSLRRPPTDGETSAALLHLLRFGVPTIVTDVGTFSDYPDTAVRKVRWESEGLAGLCRAMTELADDAEARATLGRAAWAHVREHHAWENAAALYEELIEKCWAERAPSGVERPGHARRPHFRSAQRPSRVTGC